MSLEIDDTSQSGILSDDSIDQLFSQLKAEDIEQFYMAYQLWSQRQQIKQLQLHMLSLQQKIAENAAHMTRFQPSAVALASLAQLQACGVEDVELLDTMLERGEEWLDHHIQLLERCEQLDLIGGNYTQWCEHALEGAYDWIDSMTAADIGETEMAALIIPENTATVSPEVTEAQLLKKLMSEEGEGEKVDQELAPVVQQARITQPLPVIDEPAHREEATPTAASEPLKRITQPLPATDLPAVTDDDDEATKQVLAIKLPKRITQPLPAADLPAVTDEHTDDDDEITKQVPIIKLPKRITQPLPAAAAEQAESSSPAAAIPEIDQHLTISSDNTSTTAMKPDEQAEHEHSVTPVESIDQEPPTAQTADSIDQEPPTASIDENKSNTLDNPEQDHTIAHSSSNTHTTRDETGQAVEQENTTMITGRIDQDQDQGTDEDSAETTPGADSSQPVPLQDPPSAQKMVPQKKKGFLHWLIKKILRR